MRKISIDELNDMVDSRYSLVTIISKRARQIIDGSEPLIKTNTKKPVGIAIEEFYDSEYEAIYDYDKYKKEKEALEALEALKVKAEEYDSVITDESDETDEIEETPGHEE